MNKLTEIYDSDFHAWIQQHIECLKSRQFDKLDVDNLIEELEGMANRDRRELVSHLVILMAHLLKWKYEPDFRGKSWLSSIVEQRFQISEQLEDSPSLKPFLSEAVEKAYPKAVRLAVDETNLPQSTFPEHCPYTIAQLLNKQFYPTD